MCFQTVLLCMHTTDKEIKLIKDIANKELFNKTSAKTVSFKDDDEFISLNEFFTSLNIEFDPSKVKSATSSTDSKLRLNTKSDNLPKLGRSTATDLSLHNYSTSIIIIKILFYLNRKTSALWLFE